jgi:hypothetical protein
VVGIEVQQRTSAEQRRACIVQRFGLEDDRDCSLCPSSPHPHRRKDAPGIALDPARTEHWSAIAISFTSTAVEVATEV